MRPIPVPTLASWYLLLLISICQAHLKLPRFSCCWSTWNFTECSVFCLSLWHWLHWSYITVIRRVTNTTPCSSVDKEEWCQLLFISAGRDSIQNVHSRKTSIHLACSGEDQSTCCVWDSMETHTLSMFRWGPIYMCVWDSTETHTLSMFRQGTI